MAGLISDGLSTAGHPAAMAQNRVIPGSVVTPFGE